MAQTILKSLIIKQFLEETTVWFQVVVIQWMIWALCSLKVEMCTYECPIYNPTSRFFCISILQKLFNSSMIGSLTYVTNEVFLNDDFIHLEILKVGWLNFYIYKLVHIRNSAVLISFF